MVHSLIEFGMAADDDEALRFYFERHEEPSDLSELARWRVVRRILRDRWSNWAGDVETDLSSFYESGLLTYASKSRSALDEYSRAFPDVPRPIGGAALVEWVESEKRKPPFLPWVQRLYLREVAGTTSGQEHLLLRQIRDEVADKVQGLVAKFESRKSFVERELARDAKEGERAIDSASSQRKSRGHRKFGEEPRVPEILVRRKSGR